MQPAAPRILLVYATCRSLVYPWYLVPWAAAPTATTRIYAKCDAILVLILQLLVPVHELKRKVCADPNNDANQKQHPDVSPVCIELQAVSDLQGIRVWHVERMGGKGTYIRSPYSGMS